MKTLSTLAIAFILYCGVQLAGAVEHQVGPHIVLANGAQP